MGWSWAFLLVQRMHQDIIRMEGFDAERCLVGGWPAPSLGGGAVASPYCDNLTVIGLSAEGAAEALTRLLRRFE
eukprot:8798439-Lingulodinium_polyedra.AAC.1